MRDSKVSCFIEFYYYDPERLPNQNLENFIKYVNERKEAMGIEVAVTYKEAEKFKAHNRME